MQQRRCGVWVNLSWKDKILDYEIETTTSKYIPTLIPSTWKDKILDYEIETEDIPPAIEKGTELEKIRFSITRLKRWISSKNRRPPIPLKR